MADHDDCRDNDGALARALEEQRRRSQAMVEAQRFGPPAQRVASDPVDQWDSDDPAPYERRQQGRDIEAYSDPERVARVFGPVTMSLAGLRTRKVVAEEYHQAALEQVAGPKGPRGVWVEKVAELRPEPDNAHDPNAVMVMIDGHRVAYLPAKSVAASRPLIDGAIDEHGVATCLAVINKGWADDSTVKGEFGVRLYYGAVAASR